MAMNPQLNARTANEVLNILTANSGGSGGDISQLIERVDALESQSSEQESQIVSVATQAANNQVRIAALEEAGGGGGLKIFESTSTLDLFFNNTTASTAVISSEGAPELINNLSILYDNPVDVLVLVIDNYKYYFYYQGYNAYTHLQLYVGGFRVSQISITKVLFSYQATITRKVF